MSRCFEQLCAAGNEGIADLQVALEKAWESFQSEVGGKAWPAP
jgi:hypothetical protein